MLRPDQNIGLGETALTMITGAIAEPLSGLIGLAGLPFGVDAASGATKKTQDALTWKPKTPQGMEAAQTAGKLLRPIANAVEVPSRALGDYLFDATGSEELAALGYVAPTAALELIGLKGAGKIPAKEYEFTGVGGQGFGQRGAITGFYHGGTYRGGVPDISETNRAGLGPLYGTEDFEVAQNYARSGALDSDELLREGGAVTQLNVDTDQLIDLDEFTFDDLKNVVAEDEIYDILRREDPNLAEDFTYRAEDAGFDDVEDWIKTPEGLEAIEDYVLSADPKASFEGPSVKYTDVGVFLTTKPELTERILTAYDKTGFIYEDADTMSKTVVLTPESYFKDILVEEY